MARLLRLPEATGIALESFGWIWGLVVPYKATSLSVGYPQIMKVFTDNVHKNPAFIRAIGGFLRHERNDTAARIFAAWADILQADCYHPAQLAIMDIICQNVPLKQAPLFDPVLEVMGVMFTLLVSGKNDDVQWAAVKIISKLVLVPRLRLAITPDVLTNLIHLFVSGNTSERIKIAGKTLGRLLVFREIRMTCRAVDGIMESLRNILSRMEGTGWVTLPEEDRKVLKSRASFAASILSELAEEKELRETIAALPGVEDGLLFLQLIEMGGLASKYSIPERLLCWIHTIKSTRALTTIYSNSANPSCRGLPPFEHVQKVFSWGEMPAGSVPLVNFAAYWSRAEAHRRMGNYGEVVANLDPPKRHSTRSRKNF